MTNAPTPASATAKAAPAPAHRADARSGAVFDQAFFALLTGAGADSADGMAAFAAGLSPLTAEEPPTPERTPLGEVATAEAFPPTELVAPLMAQILASTAAPEPAIVATAGAGTEAIDSIPAPGSPPKDLPGTAPAGDARLFPNAPAFEGRAFPGSARAAERAQAAPFGLGAESAWPAEGRYAFPVEARGTEAPGKTGAIAAANADAALATANATSEVAARMPDAPAAPAAALGAAEAAAPRTPPAPPSLEPIALPPASPAWKEAFAERVTLVTRSGVEEAEIVIRPAELGPVEVRVRIQEGEALLSFDAPHPETREAIELALPRLREMLAESGLAMRDAQVGTGDAGRGEDRATPGRETPQAEAGRDEAPAEPVRRRIVPGPGRVDTFV